MSAPWLSVISVVKDDAEGFERTLRSLAAQDCDSVEWVVVDSSADPDVIPDDLCGFEGNVRYEWAAPHGVYAAMNRGLEIASGDYVYFANAGDEFYSNSILAHVRDCVSGFAWAFGPVEIVYENGERVFTPAWDYASERDRGFSRGHFPSHQGTFARRVDVLECGGFDESFTVAADYALALRLSLFEDPLTLPFVVGRFFEGGLSTREWQRSFAEFHRARREILHPQGFARTRELIDTRVHWASVWLARELRPRLRARST